MEEAFYNGRDYREKRIVISRFLTPHLYNKNVLEHAKIARSGPKSMIHYYISFFTVHVHVLYILKAISIHLLNN